MYIQIFLHGYLIPNSSEVHPKWATILKFRYKECKLYSTYINFQNKNTQIYDRHSVSDKLITSAVRKQKGRNVSVS